MIFFSIPRCLWIGLAICVASTLSFSQAAKPYSYARVGETPDKITRPHAGYALMGGGTDLDEAFRWMCERAHGGDFLILRAAGTDAYNPYVKGLEDGKACKLNSVATLIIPSREAAGDPFVAETIAHAEAIFIAGGDQANYIRFWMGTPVQAAINAAIARGVPVGGTSAGLAVMGEWAYSAEGDKPDDPNLDSKTALMNPLSPRITLVRAFLDIPILKGIITDSHFVKRDRMGRLLVFLARIASESDPKIRGIGIDERSAVLIETDGRSIVVGSGSGAYLVTPFLPLSAIASGKNLESGNFDVQRVRATASFDLRNWCCGDTPYRLIVENGKVRSSSDAAPVY